MAAKYVKSPCLEPSMSANNLETDCPITVSQAVMNIAACLGAVVGPLVIGAFAKADVKDGWKNFYVRRPKFL
jgi:hypothetical protein